MELEEYKNILLDTLQSAKAKKYAGYSKFDALNSPLIKALSFKNKYLRLIFIQSVMRCPLHIRPLLGVKQSINPKGIALFVRAYLYMFEMTQESSYLDEAKNLLDWLSDNPSPNRKYYCWGYNFIWQSTLFLQDKYEPNAVVTTFACESFIHAYRITKNEKYLNIARSAVDFLIYELPVLHETAEERAISYVTQRAKSIVLNNQVLTGAAILKVWTHTKESQLLEIAEKQYNYTINRKTDYNCWYYTHPKENSPITHDNYHTGGILDGILEYWEETGNEKFMPIYWGGLEYYKTNLFENNGAPRWMNDKKYPFDIHGGAQGIISFAKAGKYRNEHFKTAELILDWTVNNLYRTRTNDFIYRNGKYINWNYSLMRWCNAWMAFSIGSFVKFSKMDL